MSPMQKFLTNANLGISRERFFEKVMKEPNSGCWLWTGALNGWGYGNFSAVDSNTGERKNIAAHRMAWWFSHQNLDEAYDHYFCRTKACVNPDHIRPCSLGDNIKQPDGGAFKQMQKTHCIHGHEFTPENTYIRHGWRGCKTCRKKGWEKYERSEASRLRGNERKRYLRKQRAMALTK